ncbi:MAG TPA: nucleotidyltransferase family protein [Methanocorpusculum sp.]|nr:nucleotidyltransferase family protein [Methanocorpusculum sp.]
MSEYTSIKNDVLNKIKNHLPEIQKKFGIAELALFGSVSRGEDTSDSDIDLLYRFGTEKITLRQFTGLKYYLEELLGRTVDLVGMDWIEPSIEPGIKHDMISFPVQTTSG